MREQRGMGLGSYFTEMFRESLSEERTFEQR